MSAPAAKQELSPEEVKAQREAKKAEKAAKAAAAKAKKEGVAAAHVTAPSADAVAVPPAAASSAAADDANGGAAKRQELSPDEVKAQREAKKAEKAAKAAASKAKAAGESAPAASPPAPASVTSSSSDKKSQPTATPAPAALPAAAASTAIDVPPNPSRPLRALPACAASYEFAHLGMLTRTLRLVGSNARTLALLRALKDLAKSDGSIATMGSLNPQSAQAALAVVKRNTEFLASCRTHSAGMTFALKTFTDRVLRTSSRTDIPSKLRVADILVRHIDDITQDIQAAIQDCATEGAQCIQPGDVVMTYGRSSSIEHAFALAAAAGVDFTVVAVDSAPLFEGRGLQWRLQQRGIKTSYVLLTSVCAIMPRVTRVFVGAASILQNGQVVSRAGTAVVSLVAKQFRRPLICFCETFKYSDRIWRGSNANAADTGSMFGGGGGGSTIATPTVPGSGIFGSSALSGTAPVMTPPQQVVSPASSLARYDAAPKDAVDHVVSEIGFLHPTAIAAAIRDRDERENRTVDAF